MFLAWRVLPRLVGQQALTVSQAIAIVENTPPGAPPTTLVGSGIYVGLVAAAEPGRFRVDDRRQARRAAVRPR